MLTSKTPKKNDYTTLSNSNMKRDKLLASTSATILQILPSLETGGVERGTVDIAEAIVEKVPSAKIETTPMKFQDSRNYQVSSEKLFNETGFEALIDLKTGINEIHDLIAKNRIKNVNHKRYSNQNFLEEYGIS